MGDFGGASVAELLFQGIFHGLQGENPGGFHSVLDFLAGGGQQKNRVTHRVDPGFAMFGYAIFHHFSNLMI